MYSCRPYVNNSVLMLLLSGHKVYSSDDRDANMEKLAWFNLKTSKTTSSHIAFSF